MAVSSLTPLLLFNAKFGRWQYQQPAQTDLRPGFTVPVAAFINPTESLHKLIQRRGVTSDRAGYLLTLFFNCRGVARIRDVLQTLKFFPPIADTYTEFADTGIDQFAEELKLSARHVVIRTHEQYFTFRHVNLQGVFIT
ncbi:hypothetical protein ACS73_16725 [Pseudomonas lini]|nr:hypothetical protein ACS73_16725 [Pseudomonas lini]